MVAHLGVRFFEAFHTTVQSTYLPTLVTSRFLFDEHFHVMPGGVTGQGAWKCLRSLTRHTAVYEVTTAHPLTTRLALQWTTPEELNTRPLQRTAAAIRSCSAEFTELEALAHNLDLTGLDWTGRGCSRRQTTAGCIPAFLRMHAPSASSPGRRSAIHRPRLGGELPIEFPSPPSSPLGGRPRCRRSDRDWSWLLIGPGASPSWGRGGRLNRASPPGGRTLLWREFTNVSVV